MTSRLEWLSWQATLSIRQLMPMHLPLSQKARRTTEQPISYLIAAAVGNPELISFAAGLVDYDTLPIEQTARAAARVLETSGRASLQYGTTAGEARLRTALLEHVCRLEQMPAQAMSLMPENVVITTGSQQALYLLTDVLVDPGDLVITARPSYFVYTGLLASFGADVRTVPMDEKGLRVDALEQLLDRLEQSGELKRLKLIYCQSYFQNPTGLSLSADRRERLVRLVERAGERAGHRIILLEDAAYRELAFEDEAPLPSLKAFDAGNRTVATTYTFSKGFAPGLKTGYALLPDDLRNAVLNQKGNHDFGSPNFCQSILREAMISGLYTEHLAELREAYRERRDLTLRALEEQFEDLGATWTVPTGGLYVWLTLAENISTCRGSRLFEEALENNVLYVPGSLCYGGAGSGDAPRNQIRLCYAVVPRERIGPGIERLAGAVRSVMGRETGILSRQSA